MKVFKFDPATGRKGEQVDTRGVANWCDCSVEFAVEKGQIEPIECAKPLLGRDSEVTIHTDAGREYVVKGGKLISNSYQHSTDWLCFCTGRYRSGLDEGTWVWVVLPPSRLIISTDPAKQGCAYCSALAEYKVHDVHVCEACASEIA